MPYRVEILPKAVKELGKLPRKDRLRIVNRIDDLAETPRPDGVVKLKGHNHRYRIRVGEYRVLYEIDDAVLRVLVIRVRHRRDAYRGMSG